MASPVVVARHIQNFSEGGMMEPHWGYADRMIPCTVDAGSCEYLDLVYSSHDRSMLYIGVIWATFAVLLFSWALIRRSGRGMERSGRTAKRDNRWSRLCAAISAFKNRWLLPEGPHLIFGSTTRLQIAILLTLIGYLTIYTFVGLTYKKWITPVKNLPGTYNTRTTLGPWSNRIGVLAYGLLPLSILLASRENLLTLITGVPYHHFNFLHRWLGYVILVQSLLHTISWTIVEAKLYQPQPSTATEWISQTYMIWGCVAMFMLALMYILTFPFVIRRTGYEFFRKAHYVLAMIFIGACWGHWEQLKCFLIPSFAIWGIDRGVRLIRTSLLHYNLIAKPDGSTWAGFQSTTSDVQIYTDGKNGDIVRLDFDQHQTMPWHVGQHYFLTFSDHSIWQSHPFTPFSLPYVKSDGKCRHSYLFRAKSGETRTVAKAIAEQSTKTTSLLLTGPYGENLIETLHEHDNVLCVAGGTGITFVLPILTYLCTVGRSSVGRDRKIKLVWVIRHASDVQWIRPELDLLLNSGIVDVSIHSTRDGGDAEKKVILLKDEPRNSQSSSEQAGEDKHTHDIPSRLDEQTSNVRPNLTDIVDTFIYSTAIGSTAVFASGPGSMTSDLRSIVARNNDAKRAFRGQQSACVRLHTDERLEW